MGTAPHRERGRPGDFSKRFQPNPSPIPGCTRIQGLPWCGDGHFLKRFEIIQMGSAGGLIADMFFSLLPPRYSWYHVMFGFLTSLFVLINSHPFFSESIGSSID